jgi:hypothetical protein
MQIGINILFATDFVVSFLIFGFYDLFFKMSLALRLELLFQVINCT